MNIRNVLEFLVKNTEATVNFNLKDGKFIDDVFVSRITSDMCICDSSDHLMNIFALIDNIDSVHSFNFSLNQKIQKILKEKL